jgi:AcrR family transcriptional regulator
MKKENKEKSCQLVGTCMGLFMKFGVKSLTMDDISRKLGISKKTLYQFVTDKKDLVKQGMMQFMEEDRKSITEISINSENAIDELIGFTKKANERFSEMNTSIVYDLQKYHPNSWELIKEHKQVFVRNSILENTKRGIAEGIYRENLNPEIITAMYMTMIDGMFQSDEYFEKNVSLEELHLEMIRYHVKGIANEKGMALLKESLSKKEHNHLNLD